MLPEGTDKRLYGEESGIFEEQIPPPGAVPVRDRPRAEPQNLEEWMQEEASLPPITEAPRSESRFEGGPELSRDVAISQALSTGETLLGSLGGLGSALGSPFLAGAADSPLAGPDAPAATPLRIGSLDVNLHASLGVMANHVGGVLYADDYAVGGLFQGGFSAIYGRDRLSNLWFSYDLAGNYPENPAQGRQGGREGGSGGFDQNASLVGTFVFPELRKVRFVFGARYSSLSGIDRDTGENSRRQIVTGFLMSSYQFTDKTSFSLDVSVPVRQFSDALSSSGLTATLFADTQLTRKTSIGFGYSYGALHVESGSDQTYSQGLLRVKYTPTRFVLFDLTLGADFRDRGPSSSVTPIFGLSATWDSRNGTLVTLAGERRVFNAASAADTNFTSTSVVASVYQRLGRSVVASLSAGYEYTQYESFGDGPDTSRTDKLYYASTGVSVPLSLHWNCSLNCSVGKNESDVSEFDFVQMTFKSTVTF